MTDDELLVECKKGLNIPEASTAFDGILTQKMLAIKSLVMGAGVSESMLDDKLAVSVIVLGVTDIWNLNGGEIRLSPALKTLVSQLAIRSYRNANVFSITYDGNGNTGGGVPVDHKAYSQGDTAIVLDNLGELTRTNYSFCGWNTSADGSGTDYDEGSSIDIGVSSVTLYAKWEAV